MLELLKAIHHLKLLPRTGWLFAGVRQPESVKKEHSYATCWLALLLAEEINTQWQQAGLAAPLNINQVVLIALVHDLPREYGHRSAETHDAVDWEGD